VTITRVWPYESTASWRSSRISPPVFESRLPVGSRSLELGLVRLAACDRQRKENVLLGREHDDVEPAAGERVAERFGLDLRAAIVADSMERGVLADRMRLRDAVDGGRRDVDGPRPRARRRRASPCRRC
jgi:hypothetical protein